VNRQIGQSDRQNCHLGRHCQAHRGDHRKGRTAKRTKRKQRAADKYEAPWPQKTRQPNETPQREEREASAEC
jgi:hypothetical protein